MNVRVSVYAEAGDLFDHDSTAIVSYTMNYEDQHQRQVLGEQCKNALRAGQIILTVPLK